MQSFRKALAVGFVAAAATAVACSSQTGSIGSGSGSGKSPSGVVGGDGTDGTVHFNFTLPDGQQLYALNWTINGPHTYTGTVHVGDAQSIEFVAGGIVAGSGYTLTLTGTSAGGDLCSGTSATFTVTAGQIVQVAFNLTCTLANDASTFADVGTGGVEIDAGVVTVLAPPTACPGITSLTIDPAEIQPNQTSQLGLVTTGPTSIITWSVTTLQPTPGPGGGTFSPSANAANPTFLPSTPGTQVQITATVALPDSGTCAGAPFTSLSALINVEGVSTPVEAGADATADASSPDSSSTDSSTVDAGPDVVAEAEASAPPPPLHARTSATDTVNAVNCQGNTGTNAPAGVCTRTEQAIVNYDILHGLSSTPGASSTNSCYYCLWQAGYINDDTFGDHGLECDDLTGTFNPDAGASGNASDLCLATANCLFGPTLGTDGGEIQGCAASGGDGVVNCYCGSGGGTPTPCKSAGAATNGYCKTQEVNGFPYSPTDSLDIVNNFNTTTYPSGQANNILVQALGVCSACFQ